MKANIALSLAVLIAGCEKSPPQSEIIATVNGHPITRQDLQAELKGDNTKAARSSRNDQLQALQRIVERRILTMEAVDRKFDKVPTYLVQKRRAEELLLVQALIAQISSAIPAPAPEQLTAFANSQPGHYYDRQIIDLDQISFARPYNTRPLQALANDHTLDAIDARLTTLGINHVRHRTVLDSAEIPSQVYAQILRVPPNEPFILPMQNEITANIILGRRPGATASGETAKAIEHDWRQQEEIKLVTSRIDALRAQAKTVYQAGFGPPSTK